MKEFSEMLEQLERTEANAIPNLHQGQTLIVVSDYSGQHRTVDFESISFLIADLSACSEWERRRKLWRQRCVPDGRRMAFKSLKDAVKLRALKEFLDAANTILGTSITILIHKEIRSLFGDGNTITWDNPELTPFKHWPKHTFERMLRIVHFISFFVAGLSRSGQNVLWLTDEDEIAANETRLRELTDIFANISSHYIDHEMGHFRCGTTWSDDGSRQIEDLASVPDLVAGMLTEAVNEQHKQGPSAPTGIIIPPPKGLQPKVTTLMNWFATNRQPLKRVVFAIEPLPNSAHLKLKRIRFHGSNDLLG